MQKAFFEIILYKIFALTNSPQPTWFYNMVQYLRLIDFFVSFWDFAVFRGFCIFCDFYLGFLDQISEHWLKAQDKINFFQSIQYLQAW